MMTLCQASTKTYRGKKTGKSAASVSSKKKKSSAASTKPAEDSDDDFMPDKRENLSWKKVLTTLCTVSDTHYVVSYFQFK